MDSINGWLLLVFQFAGDEFVGEKHEFLDELVRNVVLHLLQPDRLTEFVETHLKLGKLEIERPGVKALAAQERGEIPGRVEFLSQGTGAAWPFQNGEGFLVGEPLRAANDGFREARGLNFPGLGDFGKDRKGEALDSWLQAANSITQGLGQHRNHAVGEIHAVATRLRLTIQIGLWLHIVRDIRDVDPNSPTGWRRLDIDRIVKILRVVGVDGENKMLPQILTAGGFVGVHFRRHALGFAAHFDGKFHGEVVLSNDREHVHSGLPGWTEDFDQMALGIHMAAFPSIDFRHDLVADLSIQWRLGRQDIEIASKPGIVRHDIEKIGRFLERSNQGVIRPHENPNDPALLARGRIRARPAGLLRRNDPRHHSVAVHGCEGILRPDIQIGGACGFIQDMGSPVQVKLDHSREKIRLFGNDESVFPNAGDFSRELQIFQKRIKPFLPRWRQI